MALSDQQVETFIYQFRSTIEQIQAQQKQQTGAINTLQSNVTDLQSTNTNTNIQTGLDTYLVNGGILHKLVTKFAAAVTFAANVLISGVLTLSNALTIANGGTGAVTAAGARANISAAALPQTIQGSNFFFPGASETCSGSQSVNINCNTFNDSTGHPCSGTISFTINGTNFNVTILPVANTGSQALV